MSEPDDDYSNVVRGKLGKCMVKQFLGHRLGILHVPHELYGFLIFAYVPELSAWRPLTLGQG